MNSNQLLFLSATEVRRALPMTEAVDAMKSAFALLSAGEVVVPLRSHVEVAKHYGRGSPRQSGSTIASFTLVKAGVRSQDGAMVQVYSPPQPLHPGGGQQQLSSRARTGAP